MKVTSIAITFVTTQAAFNSDGFKAGLMNLRNHYLLNSDQQQQLTPFESVAHVQTFEEVPIYGGAELRD